MDTQFPVLAHQGLFLRRADERLAGEGVLIEVVGVDVQGPKEFKQHFFLYSVLSIFIVADGREADAQLFRQLRLAHAQLLPPFPHSLAKTHGSLLSPKNSKTKIF